MRGVEEMMQEERVGFEAPDLQSKIRGARIRGTVAPTAGVNISGQVSGLEKGKRISRRRGRREALVGASRTSASSATGGCSTN